MKQVLDARCPWCVAFGLGVVVLSGGLLMGRGEAQASRVQAQAESDASHLLEQAGFGWIQVRIADGQARLEGESPDDAVRVAALAAARRALAPMMGYPGVFASIVDGMTVVPAPADETLLDASVSAPVRSGDRSGQGREDPAALESPATCLAAMNEQLEQQPIQFDFASTRLTPNSLVALDAVLPILKTCPPATLTVVAHADASGDSRRNEYLALARARAVQAALSKAGGTWASMRLRGVVDAPAMGDSNGGASAARRVEFQLASAATP